MLKRKTLGKGKYVKAKTPEAKIKQRAAIVDYYVKKRAEEKKKNKPWQWLSKVSRRGENLVQFLKISAGFVLDAKTFGASWKSDF